jgi:hypothetical protein
MPFSIGFSNGERLEEEWEQEKNLKGREFEGFFLILD